MNVSLRRSHSWEKFKLALVCTVNRLYYFLHSKKMSNTIFGTMYISSRISFHFFNSNFQGTSRFSYQFLNSIFQGCKISNVLIGYQWPQKRLKTENSPKLLTLMMSESFVEIYLKPNLLSSQKWFASRNVLRYFFLSSISDPNDCSTMPFSMSKKHNETSEFKAGCPGAVSG